MNANELKAKARERLAEIAKQRAVLASEEAELKAMMGEPIARVVTCACGNTVRVPERDASRPMVRPMPYDVHRVPPAGFEPYIVARENEGPTLAVESCATRNAGCAVPT